MCVCVYLFNLRLFLFINVSFHWFDIQFYFIISMREKIITEFPGMIRGVAANVFDCDILFRRVRTSVAHLRSVSHKNPYQGHEPLTLQTMD